MASIKMAGISKRFGRDSHVVEGIDLEVHDGEFLVLLGPSGCGKSTLLRMIAGLEKSTAGEIWIGDRMVNELAPRQRDVAMVFQSYALYPTMTIHENIAFGLKMGGVGKRSRDSLVKEVAEMLDLTKLLPKRPRELSGGQRQRVALGRAIVRRPKVFLLDEPLSNLDAKLRTRMRVELQELHRRLGTTFVYVTHDQVEAMTMGDRIVVLHDGKLQQVGTPDDLYSRPANTFVAGFLGSPGINLIRAHASAGIARASGFSVKMPASVPDGEVLLGIRPEDLVLDAGGHDDRASLQLRVSVVESLGSRQFVYGSCGDDRLVVEASHHIKLAYGDVIHLGVREDRICVFDTTSRELLAAGTRDPGIDDAGSLPKFPDGWTVAVEPRKVH
jgi:ABC-type sugar transport system ATPase subunit